MSFLKSEVKNEERINMEIRGFNLEGSSKGARTQKTESTSQQESHSDDSWSGQL